jgi:hypothetical protein
MGAVLAIVYRVIATHLAPEAGFGAKRARTGAVGPRAGRKVLTLAAPAGRR